jgi:glycosyltransferase involved in cell wall biosynthesis
VPPEPDTQPAGPPPRRYRFAFVLNTTIGNLTRYVNLRKFAERDPEVDGHWVPVHMVASPRAEAFLRLLPRSVALRLRVAIQVFPTWVRLGRFDAVMLHVFEAEVACAVRSYLFRRPALISSTDEAPVVDRTTYPLYPHQQGKSQRREEFRLKLDRWRATRIDSFVPFTAWGGRILEQGCGVPGERIFPIHVGLDLEQWRPPDAPSMREGRPRLLFVGTDFERKGGPLLLSVFERCFASRAELHIVSANAPLRLPPQTFAYRDLGPNDPRLVDLYATCDVLVLPTTADLVPWTVLEAMAMRLPVVSTTVGAIAELVDDGLTGYLVEPNDDAALAQAMTRLVDDAALRQRMGCAGRARVERDFDAASNVPRILAVMKAVANRRALQRRGAPAVNAGAGAASLPKAEFDAASEQDSTMSARL